mmetsp:Transcript_15654/g.20686  ORF Transcript_15654/g.20686 Transcript_15654/m.20686 type:complete len:324 (+) Transcript_15654:136-1107(+)
MLLQTLTHIIIYAGGTFYAQPLKVVWNAAVGSRYAIAYAHFRRDHSDPLNVWLHAAVMLLQVAGNFALLEVIDSMWMPQQEKFFSFGITSITALLWMTCLLGTTSPLFARISSCLLIACGFFTRKFFTAHFVSLTLAQAPLEIACFWLLMPEHGLPRPNSVKTMVFMLLGRLALWKFVLPFYGYFATSETTAWILDLILVAALAVGSLIRASDNMPYAEHIGLFAWLPALLFNKPWLFFLCGSFVGQALQGVAHEISGQQGTLPQLKDARHEIAHCTYFPNLVLQTIHHSQFGPYVPTAKALGDYPDPRSRLAMGLSKTTAAD